MPFDDGGKEEWFVCQGLPATSTSEGTRKEALSEVSQRPGSVDVLAVWLLKP